MYNLSSSSWSKEELLAIHRVMESGRYTMGREVTMYEHEFAAKFRSRFAVMVNSGSSANLLTIAALTFKQNQPLCPGDEIIVPVLSWPTMFYPVCQYQMKLVFVDVNLDELNIDVRLLEGALSKRTKAVFVPHILGSPARILEIQEFCQNHGLYLIEDNCESMGAKVNFKHTGTFGICGTFSTFFSHHISTMEGGMIVTDDEEIYHILLALRSHGWTRHLPSNTKICKKTNDDFYEAFHFILPGYNLRPLEISGAVGREQLKKLDKIIESRKLNAKYFKELFTDQEHFILQREYGESSYFGFSMILSMDSSLKRSSIIKALQQADIEVRPIVTGNFLENDVIQYLDYRVGWDNLMMAEHIHKSGFYVGNHSFDIRSKLDYLKETLCKLLN